jgi:hypothetical protein
MRAADDSRAAAESVGKGVGRPSCIAAVTVVKEELAHY